MSADTTTNSPANTLANSPASDARVFVEIPRARPGQEYRAPKNIQQPLLSALSRLAIIGACASLPLAPAVIIALIVFFPLTHNQPIADGLLPLWIVMTLFIMPIAIFIAIGVAREALGASGGGRYTR